MTRRRPNVKKNKPTDNYAGKQVRHHTNVLQTNKLASNNSLPRPDADDESNINCEPTIIEAINGIKSLLDDEEDETNNDKIKPQASSSQQPSTSSGGNVDTNLNTETLYNELDSFRQRWKRELGDSSTTNSAKQDVAESEASKLKNRNNDQENVIKNDETIPTPDNIYAKAKELFLIAVEYERDEMYPQSIRYYKQAMHLCPDIEMQIYLEQCEASKNEEIKTKNFFRGRNQLTQGTSVQGDNGIEKRDGDEIEETDTEKIPLFDRIFQAHLESNLNKSYSVCSNKQKLKPNSVHISHLPHELLLKIFHYIVGEELDLASLEQAGLVCRGFYLLSRDLLLWRSICFNTWKSSTMHMIQSQIDTKMNENNEVNWRQMYLNRPRVNFDGVYISRTRYIRQGDVGFQNLTYLPFHIVRYYRYLRFFPDRRVLILTTNEEPEKIVPIFRHALHKKQFSPELAILEGTYEYIGETQINIMAERDSTLTPNQRRQPQYWSRQTPISQKLNMKFELRSDAHKPYRNNVLKWLEYTLSTRLETGLDVELFDITMDLFPNMIFSRVKRFNLKSANPLSSHI